MSDFVIELQGTQVSKPPMVQKKVLAVVAALPALEPAFCEICSIHLKVVFSDTSGLLC